MIIIPISQVKKKKKRVAKRLSMADMKFPFEPEPQSAVFWICRLVNNTAVFFTF